MRIRVLFVVLIILRNLLCVVAQIPCWLQEVHYQNFLVDTNEFIEIGCRQEVDIAGWTVHLYRNRVLRRNNYGTFNFEDLAFTATGAGVSLYVLTPDSIEQGGVVIADANSNIIEFASFGGEFTASDGIANGVQSSDIGFREGLFARPDNSLQLVGSGCAREQFVWQSPSLASPGTVNFGQVFSCTLIPSQVPSHSPTLTFAPSFRPTNMPSIGPSALPTSAPSACESRCYFSCLDVLIAPSCGQESGIYEICPEGHDGLRTPVYCDLTTAGGGWMLLYSYNHTAGDNANLVNTTPPLDPNTGYSHFYLNSIAGYNRSDILALRFYCRTSAHNRVMHFINDSPIVRNIAYDANLTENTRAAWREHSKLLPEHNAFLPRATLNVDLGESDGFNWFPFWRLDLYHWGIRGSNVRWECDDTTDGPDESDTLHNVWVLMNGLLVTESPSEIPTDTPSQVPSDIPSGFPSIFPTASPSEFPSILPSSAPTSCAAICFFSCADAYNRGCLKSGLYDICPTGPNLGNSTNTTNTTVVYCDQENANGGWMLMYSYNHTGGENFELDNATIPLDPVNDYSHFFVNQINGYAEENIKAVRFYCETEGHDRIIHFYNNDTVVTRIAWDGDQDGNFGGAWNGGSTTLLPGHSAFLPLQADSADAEVGGGGFNRFPFFATGQYHWGIRGVGFRWECDDFPDGPGNSTIHLVWVRVEEG